MSSTPQAFNLNREQLQQGIALAAQARPDIAQTLRDSLARAAGAPVRVRSGVLVSTIGFALDANGQVPVAQTNQAFFVNALGMTDAVLGVLTPALTTLLTPGKTNGGTSFLAKRLAIRPWIVSASTAVAPANAATHAQTMVNLLHRLGLKASLNTNDQQYMGPAADWPAPGYSVNGAPGDVLDASAAPATSLAAAGLRADGAMVACPLEDELLIGPNATLRVDAPVGPNLPIDTSMSGAIIAVSLTFYGSELAAVQG